MQKEVFYSKWSTLHGGAEISGIVRAWLAISFQCARIASALRISPNLLTLLGVVAAGLMTWKPFSFLTIALLALSLFADGIDGSVAIYEGRASRWGATLDSFADRVSEGLWLYVAYQVGIPAWLAISLWIIAATQEYARARAASLGHTVISVVTPTERPVRASVIFILLVGLYVGIAGIDSIAYVLLAAQFISLFLVVRDAFASLK
jgi:CDP-diacylglycerol--glycerol-3-phosphate 3-phosphatidyltransferase